MSCLCTQKVAQTVASLLPVGPIKVDLPPIPDVLTQLGKTPGASSISSLKMSASVQAQLGALLALNLPALKIDATALAQLQGVMPTVAHVQSSLGVNLLAPKLPTLSAIMKQANQALPALAPLADVDPGPLMSLASVLMVLQGLKATMGLNLMKPGMRAQLAAALQVAPPPLALAPLAALAPYGVVASALAALNLSLTTPNVMPKLTASLTALASLPIPPLAVPAVPMAKISALLMATSTTKQILGFSPIGNAPRLAVTLAPLAELEGLTIPETFKQAASAATLLSMVMPLLKVNAKALATANIALPPLPIPDLSAVATVASVASYGLGSPKACGDLCGMAGELVPSGLVSKVSSMFS